MSAILTLPFFGCPAQQGQILVVEDATGYVFDFDDSTFKLAGSATTDFQVPIETTALPGTYTWSITQEWTGLYHFYWYADATRTTAPEVWSVVLTAGVAGDPIAEIQTKLDQILAMGGGGGGVY